MPAPLRVVHTQDPKEVLYNATAPYLKDWKIKPTALLLAMYERGKNGGEAKTAGGIIVPDVQHGSLKEDKYQGKVGLVMKVGELAFQDDETHAWGEFKPKVGDWVVVNVGDTFSFDIPDDRRCRIVDEQNVRAVVPVPDTVW